MQPSAWAPPSHSTISSTRVWSDTCGSQSAIPSVNRKGSALATGARMVQGAELSGKAELHGRGELLPHLPLGYERGVGGEEDAVLHATVAFAASKGGGER
jgi:hypothetical protein